MSQPPYPPRPDQPPPPGWQPGTPPGGQPPYGYDPTRPLGPQAPAHTSISEFAPPRSRAPWLIGLGSLLIAVIIILTATLPSGTPGAAGSASPSPTPTPTLPGQPFTTTDGRVDGRWEIVEHHWDEAGVRVLARVAVDRGTLQFSFLAFANDAVEVLYPSPGGGDQPDFGLTPLPAGEQREGWLYFSTPRTQLTLILTTEVGRQISALVVDA